MTSVLSFPVEAALLKIAPISSMEMPAAAAELDTIFSVRSNLAPGSMPAATAPAATVAASPSPNAVPLTEARAFFMIASTACVS